MSHIKYSVVIPVYNEELLIEESYRRLKKVMDSTDETYELIFVDDGSHDKSAEILSGISMNDRNVKLISFSRNFGHQTAITAGMDNAKGDAVVVIDADLQDPPEVILKMIEKWKEGYDVVYGKRAERKGESFFKLFTARVFYRLLKSLTNVDIPVDTGDFRLIDRKVCDVMNSMTSIKEKNRYIRGLVSWVGFKQTGVEYVRDPRLAGETKYTLKKMLKLAMDGITSFSYAPLKLPLNLGVFLLVTGFAYLIVELVLRIAGVDVSIENTVIAINMILFGLNFSVLGAFGEYIGRIYDEVRDRPLYIIARKVGFDDGKTGETR
ncbi:glycosyl transferase family 2 [Thermoanaerobacterium xylanolyticum LX-11]|uniref:Glycosyl transferase family 2 n=1 Tax=Thermoanaerobacterium xylanolyticum (strain ATCC 49914 / DSM 7097 / LX-11) TaxID=858215 RepID=F6BLA6_THEXL|nr:glycosyltransferase family 2 protein [Thermoanaerobacterium xylanolyticum]AEF18239.1 glycosyl transferase family 2 [Thermoanaerobacterium xylanolyticum LX-11]